MEWEEQREVNWNLEGLACHRGMLSKKTCKGHNHRSKEAKRERESSRRRHGHGHEGSKKLGWCILHEDVQAVR